MFAIDRVTLTVRDLDRVADFYARLGLHPLRRSGQEIELGAGPRTLLALRCDPAARPAPAGTPGLFHTAFLLPDRRSLGRWLAAAETLDLRLTGAADHGVSEALYLYDPEGNGIEVYADRPRQAWPSDGAGGIDLPSRALDRAGLRAAGGVCAGARLVMPTDTTVGHVHLRAGTLSAWAGWASRVGLAVTHRRPGAVFLAAGAYHHHLAANVWGGTEGGARPEGLLGLAELYVTGLDTGVPAPDGIPVRGTVLA